MNLDFKSILSCNIDPPNQHWLKDAYILTCGCTYCLNCIKREISKINSIECKKCNRIVYVDNLNESIRNRTVDILYQKFPIVYKYIIDDAKYFIYKYSQSN